jgi:OHCU decarboxylase
MRFSAGTLQTGEDFFVYLRDTFDTLWAEGAAGAPKMMSVGLHCRLAGRPGRAAGLVRFLDHVEARGHAWLATRAEIAAHWRARHPAPPVAERPTTLAKDAFVARFGGVFEHSPWIAERAFALELGPAHDTATGLHSALARAFRSASPDERLGVLNAHPDLAGKLAAAKRLTAESTAEQAGAGLDALTDADRARFTELNDAYQAKFGFPFIIAVRGLDRHRILRAFESRLANDRDTELAAAAREVERIALLRLRDMLP